MSPGLGLRIIGVRAVALGGVATVSGTLGHVQAGGADPTPVTIAWVWLGASVLSVGFLISRVGLFRIAALLLAEQVLVHMSLMWLVGMPSSPPVVMPTMPGMGSMPGMAVMPAMSELHMSLVPSTSMLAAHALAAVVAGLWLWRGECALWSLLTRAGAALRLRWLALAVLVAVPDLRIEADTLPRWGVRIAREVPRRGPPQYAMR